MILCRSGGVRVKSIPIPYQMNVKKNNLGDAMPYFTHAQFSKEKAGVLQDLTPGLECKFCSSTDSSIVTKYNETSLMSWKM